MLLCAEVCVIRDGVVGCCVVLENDCVSECGKGNITSHKHCKKRRERKTVWSQKQPLCLKREKRRKNRIQSKKGFVGGWLVCLFERGEERVKKKMLGKKQQRRGNVNAPEKALSLSKSHGGFV